MLCLLSLLVLTLESLCGMWETSAVFLLPTYLFLACIGTTLIIGIAKAVGSGGNALDNVAKRP
jgi:hypothetical protein